MPKVLSDEEKARRLRINRFLVPITGSLVLLLFVLIAVLLLTGGDDRSDSNVAQAARERTTTTTGARRSVDETTATTLAPTTTTAAPTATTTAAPSKVDIPGLDPLDVTLNLKERGFSCGNPSQGKEYRTYSCDRGTDNVSVFTTDAREVDQIEVSAFGPEAKELMAYVATAPYSGSTPRAAMAWVEAQFSHIRQGAPIETAFGGVPYSMYGNPSGGAYFLEIGKLSD